MSDALKRVYGIDLGTNYSAIAYVDEHGKPVVVPNAESERITPSVVLFDGENVIVGNTAKEAAKVEPDRVVSRVKQHMGDPNFVFSHDGLNYGPEDISSFVLRKVVGDAEMAERGTWGRTSTVELARDPGPGHPSTLHQTHTQPSPMALTMPGSPRATDRVAGHSQREVRISQMMRNGGLMVFVLGWVIAGGAMAAAPDRHVVVISVDGLPGSFLDDPKASIPNIRALRDKGVGAKRGMTVSNPSVTWPNHTTLMTGVYPDQHGVIYNGRPVRGGVNQPTKVISASSQAELVRIPLLFDILKEAGQTSAAIYWPCTRESKSLLVNFPDVPNSLQYTTESLKAKLTELPRYSIPDTNGAVYDEVWTEATCRTILDDKPNLVALHLLVVDGTHHDFGPNTNAGYTAVALADANVGRVLAAIDRAGIADTTDVFIVSDHGFTTVPQSIRPNAILRREGLLEADGKKITSCRVQVVPEGGIGMVYLTDPATRDADRATFHRLFDKAEGVAQIIDPSDFSQYHFPDPADHPGMADMVIAARDGYAVSGSPVGDDFVGPNDGNIGSHGFLSTEPKMVAIFVAAGPNIQPGAPLDQIANVDIAPTIARLLNVTLDPVAGRPLTEILRPSSARD